MTVAELCNKLQDIAHQGYATMEVKDVDRVLLTSEGVYLINRQPELMEDIAENPKGLWQC